MEIQEEADKSIDQHLPFIKQFSAIDPVYKDYTAFFLSYYAFYLPVNFIEGVCEAINFNFDIINDLLPEIRNRIIERPSKKRMVIDHSLSKTFFSILLISVWSESIAAI